MSYWNQMILKRMQNQLKLTKPFFWYTWKIYLIRHKRYIYISFLSMNTENMQHSTNNKKSYPILIGYANLVYTRNHHSDINLSWIQGHSRHCLLHSWNHTIVNLGKNWQQFLELCQKPWIQFWISKPLNKKGGVGLYIEDTIKLYKIRSDIIENVPSFEHLWVKWDSKNSKQCCLLGVIYQSNFELNAGKDQLTK